MISSVMKNLLYKNVVLIFVMMLSSCATYATKTISIAPSVSNEKIFDCTVKSVSELNRPLGLSNHSGKDISNRIFQENIMYKNINRGRIILGKRDNSLSNYPVDVTRVNNNIVIRSSGYGLYYSNDFNLEPNISRLSKSIEECIVEE